MKMLQEMVLIGEIAWQTKVARRAGERLQSANDDLDKIEVWSSIQLILVSAGNVSKLLWPSKKKSKLRGEYLRKQLKVGENNILSDRKFRNHFEHYDERIEEWFENCPSAVYRDFVMNPSLSSSGFISTVNRGYNSFNNTLVFRGEILDLGEVLDALEKIRLSCKPYTRI